MRFRLSLLARLIAVTLLTSLGSTVPSAAARPPPVNPSPVKPPPVYVVLFTHIEDDTPSGDLGSAISRASYDEWRSALLAMGALSKAYGMPWVLQPDYTFLLAAERYEDAATMASTGGKNVLKYLLDDKAVVIDPHSHEHGGYNYSDVYWLLRLLGVGGSSVVGGHVWDPSLPEFGRWDRFRSYVYGQTYKESTWRGDILMGAGTPNHKNDPVVSGVWRPQDKDHFFDDDPAGNIVSVGAYTKDIAGVTKLIGLYRRGTVAPTLMLTSSIHLTPANVKTAASRAALEASTLAPLRALRASGGVEITDFTRLVAIWRQRFGGRAFVHRE